ncbi:hypothetical protein [Streptomyces sp. GB4-14]|uniref:hypothetical protein n=1 Tax=Streptomyces sp. GB4-14 TaxID=2498703 RepID=UPI001F5E42FC
MNQPRRCGNDPRAQLTDGDRQAVDNFRAYLGLRATSRELLETAVWVDGDPLMEAMAAAVWEHCRTEHAPAVVVDDPRNIAAVAAVVARAVSSAGQPQVPAPLAALLATPCAVCPHTLNWHRHVGCIVGSCGCGRFEEQPDPEADEPQLTAEQQVRGVQAWMALDLHQALGWPVDHGATVVHQGRKSWSDWWAELLAGVRNVQMMRRYRGELPEPAVSSAGQAPATNQRACPPGCVACAADESHDPAPAAGARQEATALELLPLLASPEPCRWDGLVCTTHSWRSDIGRCPHGQAQKLLGGGTR